MSEKQETAVQWFAFELSKLGLLPDGVPDDIYKQAKEMEKERMIDFGCLLTFESKHIIEDCYNEIYGGNK